MPAITPWLLLSGSFVLDGTRFMRLHAEGPWVSVPRRGSSADPYRKEEENRSPTTD